MATKSRHLRLVERPADHETDDRPSISSKRLAEILRHLAAEVHAAALEIPPDSSEWHEACLTIRDNMLKSAAAGDPDGGGGVPMAEAVA